jgi:hypothetical protein
MEKLDWFCARKRSPCIGVPPAGLVSVVMLLLEVGLALFYFGLISLGGFFGSAFMEPNLLIVWVGCVTMTMLCFLAFVGTVLCALGVASRKFFFKWLLISLSFLGMIPLAVSAYNRFDDLELLVVAFVLTGWSVLLFVTTRIAFSYLIAMPPSKDSDFGKLLES